MAATAAAGTSPCQNGLNSPSRQKYTARPAWAIAYTPSAQSVTTRLSREKAGSGWNPRPKPSPSAIEPGEQDGERGHRRAEPAQRTAERARQQPVAAQREQHPRRAVLRGQGTGDQRHDRRDIDEDGRARTPVGPPERAPGRRVGGQLADVRDPPADGRNVEEEDEGDADQHGGQQDRPGYGPPWALCLLAEIGRRLESGEGQHAEHRADDDTAESGRTGTGAEDVRVPVAARRPLDEDGEREREQDPEFERQQCQVGPGGQPTAPRLSTARARPCR